MTQNERLIISAYTGVLMCDFADLHKYIEGVLGRPVYTNELAGEAIWKELKEKTEPAFMDICSNDCGPALLTVTFITPAFRQAQAVCEGIFVGSEGRWMLEGVQHADWQPDAKTGSYVEAPAGYQLLDVMGGV